MNLRPLNLSDEDRVGCTVTYNVNRFEVYHADGWMMTAAQTKTDLNSQLWQNGLLNAKFDAIASCKYLNKSAL